MNRKKIIEVLQNGNSPIKDELIEALQNCPPGHHVMLGNDEKVYTVRNYPISPKDLWGEPGDGKLFDL
jgi:hypothetical protein